MLSRKQLRLIQVVRGLSVPEIIQRTGIPAQSLMAFIGSNDRENKDPSKLMSQVTYDRVLSLLGIDHKFTALRSNGVIEWRYKKDTLKGHPRWFDAVQHLRKDLFSADVEMAEVKKQTGLFTKGESMLFLRDNEFKFHIVITNVNKAVRRQIRDIFGIETIKTQTLSPEDYAITAQLVANGVYRISQFNIVVGGKVVKYSWDEVMAAAKEFNFVTDDLIELMVERVTKAEQHADDTATPALENEPQLRVVAAG